MSRPKSERRLAAELERDKLRAQGLPDEEIRQLLMQTGLTRQQVCEIVPSVEPVKEQQKPKLEPEAKTANIEGAIHFLETVAKTLKPNLCDRFPELTETKSNSLTWARKLRGIL